MTKGQILAAASTNDLSTSLFKAAICNSEFTLEEKKAIVAAYEAIAAKKQHRVETDKATFSVKQFGVALKESASGAFATLGNAILAHPFLAIAAAATLATIAIKKFTEAQEANKRELESLQESYNSLESDVTSLSSEIETNVDRIKELQGLEAPTLADEAELRKLKEINAELKLQLELKKASLADDKQKMAGAFVGAMQDETNGSHYVAFTSTFMTNSEAEQKAQRDILEARRKIAEEGEQMDEAELARQKQIIAQNQEYLSSRLSVYEQLAEGMEYGVSPEADAFLNYVKDLRIATLAVSDSATSASTALGVLFKDNRYTDGVQQIKDLLNPDDIDGFAAALKKAYDAGGEDSSLVQLIDRLQELGYFSWDNVEGLANTFAEVEVAANSASDAVLAYTESLDALSEKYDLLQSAQSEFKDSGVLTVSTLNQIKEKFPALSTAVDEYILGLRTGEQLLAELSGAYLTDEAAYKSSLVAKAQASTTFFNQNQKALSTLIDNLADGYGVDLKNYKTVEEAKFNFSKIVLQRLADAWGRYYGLTAKNVNDAALQMGNRLSSIAYQYGENSPQYKSALAEATDLSNAAAAINNFAKALDDFTVDKVNFDPKKFYNQDTSTKKSSDSSSKTKSMEELYKELVTLQTNITRADDRLEKKAEDTTEEQIALWLKLRKAAVAELSKIKDHTSEAYRFVEEIVQDANSHLDDLYDQQLDALDSIIDKVKDLIKQEVEDQCDALDKQAEKFRELVDLKRKLLEDTQKESDYEDEIAEKVKAISDLQTRIAQLQLEINANPNDSRAAQAEQRKLQEELAKLQKELTDAQDEHYRDSLDARLDDEADAFEQQKKDEIEQLKETIDSEAKLYKQAIDYINKNWDSLYRKLLQWNFKYGSGIDSDITKAWETAKDAVDKYGGSIESAMEKIKEMQSRIQSTNMNGNYNQVGDGSSSGSSGGSGASSGSGSGSGGTTGYGKAVAKYGAAPTGKPNLLNGSKGKQVQWLQYYLDQVVNGGSGALKVDGIFGSRTKAALQTFQKMAGVKVDGILGPATASKLKKYHTGGVVGRDLGLKEREQLAILKDEEWVATGKQFRNVKGLLDAFAQIKKSLPRIQPLPVRPTPAIAGAGGNVFETNVDVRIEHHGDFDDKAAAKFADLVANKATKKLNDVMTRQGVRK